jgi:hypothetical protein
MKSYWMVVMKQSSDVEDRDVLEMVVQTDGQQQPSAAEIFEAAAHFGGRFPEGHLQSIRAVGAFQPDSAALTKMTAVSGFTCAHSRFWDARNI